MILPRTCPTLSPLVQWMVFRQITHEASFSKRHCMGASMTRKRYADLLGCNHCGSNDHASSSTDLS